MALPDRDQVRWRTSSHSDNQGACVEVALGADAAEVRDSKSPASGQLRLTALAFKGFLELITD